MNDEIKKQVKESIARIIEKAKECKEYKTTNDRFIVSNIEGKTYINWTNDDGSTLITLYKGLYRVCILINGIGYSNIQEIITSEEAVHLLAQEVEDLKDMIVLDNEIKLKNYQLITSFINKAMEYRDKVVVLNSSTFTIFKNDGDTHDTIYWKQENIDSPITTITAQLPNENEKININEIQTTTIYEDCPIRTLEGKDILNDFMNFETAQQELENGRIITNCPPKKKDKKTIFAEGYDSRTWFIIEDMYLEPTRGKQKKV